MVAGTCRPRADGITVPDLVFPGFLFMVGMAIPLAMQRHCGHVTPTLLGRLLWRSASLLLATRHGLTLKF